MTMAKFIPLYYRLPYPLRVISASARGYFLRSWRYSGETSRYIAEAAEREAWSAAEWQAWRDERLPYVLERAAKQVPYYRDYWQAQRRKGDKRSWVYLENWPILTKDALRASPYAFIADDCDVNKMFHEQTSGTTGTPVHTWRRKETIQRWYALFEQRVRQWYGITRKDRWAMIGAQLVVPYAVNEPPFWVWNFAMNQLYLSAYHLGRSTIAAYLRALNDHYITNIVTFPSSVYTMAHLAEEAGLQAPRMKAIFTNGEQLFAHQKETVERVFGCRVVDTYGMVELASAGSECLSGQMHLWPEVAVTEILSETSDDRLPAGEVGRIIGTGLLNADNPLIRYQVGDLGALSADEQKCTCGRSLPVICKLEGRIGDVVLTPDGRRVGMLLPVLVGFLGITEAQIIQESLDTIRVLVVPTPGYTQADGDLIAQRLHTRVGEMEIVIEKVESIPREANGKFRAVVSRLAQPGAPNAQTRPPAQPLVNDRITELP